MTRYYYCPNCGNDDIKELTLDCSWIYCRNLECRFCCIVEPPNFMGDSPREYTTTLNKEKWEELEHKYKEEN